MAGTNKKKRLCQIYIVEVIKEKHVDVIFCIENIITTATDKKITLVENEVLDESITSLQVDSWIYPLNPEVLPSFRCEASETFIFPDINSEIQDACVKIILPKEICEQGYELLAFLLNETSVTGRSGSIEIENGVSCKCVRGATYISQYLIRKAGNTAQFLDSLTKEMMNHINPDPQPKEISSEIQKTVERAKKVSEKAVHVTDYLATKICMATSILGRYLYPHIQKIGTQILMSTNIMTQEEAAGKINSVLNVTSNAFEGLSTVYSGLNTAASILAQSFKDNSVQLVEHKYGQPAGALTNDAITTFKNMYNTRQNIRFMKPKGIVQATARGTGKALLEDYKISNKFKATRIISRN